MPIDIKKIKKEIKKLEQKHKEKFLSKLFEQLYFYATHDVLTGLWNKSLLNDILGKEVSRAIRHKKTFSIMLIDIDDFKKYNDKFGHLQGDEALKTVTGVIIKNIRKEDFAVRFGGEEFLIVLPETNAAKALNVAKRIREIINNIEIKPVRKNLPQGYEKVSVSIGISEFKGNINEALEKADKALYKAKKLGKNKIVIIR
ncbi:MAG: GGDEF domain-containing protein [Candidatus Pacearchaeota archaeon]